MTKATVLDLACTIQGWMSRTELSWLYDRAEESTSCLELGCWRGRSTFVLASACPGLVYAVDHFRGTPSELTTSHKDALTSDIHREWLDNLAPFTNTHLLHMSSEDAARIFTFQIPFVFIDGDHTEPAISRDLDLWLPRTSRLLAGHDYSWSSVRRAVDRKFSHAVRLGPGSIWYIDLENAPPFVTN